MRDFYVAMTTATEERNGLFGLKARQVQFITVEKYGGWLGP